MSGNFLILKGIRLPYMLYLTHLCSFAAPYDPQVYI